MDWLIDGWDTFTKFEQVITMIMLYAVIFK